MWYNVKYNQPLVRCDYIVGSIGSTVSASRFPVAAGKRDFFYCVKKLAIDPGVDFVHCGLSFGRRWGAGVTAHEVIIRALGVLLDVLRE